MEIKTKDLSKEALTLIVETVREAKIIPDHLVKRFYRQDLVKQILAAEKQLDALEKRFKRKRIPREEHQRLMKRYRQICVTANKKIDIVRGLDDAGVNSGEGQS
ncbi:hypothetical protein [Desulfofustis glycolicus]|uniref:Uncharacterized protein n=1 Tax=Desulfofustis glycolicus DSM 9705 TaxID=1121409 RepID=A0A1M5S5T1_9BACT|nr:hypothetical protein [Desulfofustis glycolicus]SHH33839.1 hypothetical protein SAMN02745124_00176 [Desulfofustis glycolicus DSM 9705]